MKPWPNSPPQTEDRVKSCVCAMGVTMTDGNCTACPVNFYKSEIGPAPCSECIPLRRTREEMSTSIDDCVCIIGYGENPVTFECEELVITPTGMATFMVRVGGGYYYLFNMNILDLFLFSFLESFQSLIIPQAASPTSMAVSWDQYLVQPLGFPLTYVIQLNSTVGGLLISDLFFIFCKKTLTLLAWHDCSKDLWNLA